MELFPFLGRVGFTETHRAPHDLVVYRSGVWRRYKHTDWLEKRLTLIFTDYTTPQVDQIIDFVDARFLADLDSDNFEFLVYNPRETYVMSGTTGLYVAIFDTDEFSVENVSHCTWNVTLDNILLLRAGDAPPPEEAMGTFPNQFPFTMSGA